MNEETLFNIVLILWLISIPLYLITRGFLKVVIREWRLFLSGLFLYGTLIRLFELFS